MVMSDHAMTSRGKGKKSLDIFAQIGGSHLSSAQNYVFLAIYIIVYAYAHMPTKPR